METELLRATFKSGTQESKSKCKNKVISKKSYKTGD